MILRRDWIHGDILTLFMIQNTSQLPTPTVNAQQPTLNRQVLYAPLDDLLKTIANSYNSSYFISFSAHIDYQVEAQSQSATTRIAASKRNDSRNSRHAHPANFDYGPRARSHDRARDRERVGGCSSDRARLSLSGSSSTGGPRLDRLVLGDVGKQPEGEVLPRDARWSETIGDAGDSMGTARSSDRTNHETYDGVNHGLAAFLSQSAMGSRAG